MTSEDLKQIKAILEAPFSDLKKDVGDLKKEVGKLGEKINYLDKKVDGLDGKTNRLVAVTVSIREDLNTKFATKNDLFGVKNEILNHLDGLAKKINNHDENMEHNKWAQGKLNRQLQALKREVGVAPNKF